jgi:hypothetical protein
MSGLHSKLIIKLSKALSMLSQKVYTDILTEKDPSQDYSLFNLLSECRNELAKIDDRDLMKIAKMVEKESQ